VALITDEDNVYYLTGYYDYLHMEFGRPTILVVSVNGGSLLITPTIDLNTAQAAAKVDRIAAWNDGMGEEWRTEIPGALRGAKRIALEPDHMPPLVRAYINQLWKSQEQTSVTQILANMRMIKSAERWPAHRQGHAKRPSCWQLITAMQTCRQTHTSYRSWPPATPSPKPIIGPPQESCVTVSRCFCVSVV